MSYSPNGCCLWLKMDSVRDKENIAKIRCPRTKKEQFDLLFAFHNENNVEVMCAETYNRRWNDTTVKLNSMGPPEHSTNEWKRVWSERKYNKKRKRTDEELSSKSDVMVPNVTAQQQNHFDEHICVPVASLLQDCTALFGNVCDQSGELNAVLDTDNVFGTNEEIVVNNLNHRIDIDASNVEMPSNSPFAQTSISSFACDHSDQITGLLTQISKKLDVIIDKIVESNNLQKDLLKRQ